MELWWASKIPLLRRLTVYGVGVDPKMVADATARMAFKQRPHFYIWIKKEVFDILAIAYPHSSEPAREKVLRRIARGPKGRQRKTLEPKTIAYEQFNVLVWLRRADKNCPLVKDTIAKIQKLYPEFGEREHPNFDHWTGKSGFIDPKEGFNFNQILSEPPGNYLAELQKATENSIRRDLWSYLDKLKLLFSRNKEWGRGFMEALTKQMAQQHKYGAAFFGHGGMLSKALKIGNGFSAK